ncbi:MAG: sulfur oxidation c-type cytochrome SoxX [Deltaproteobacteria bacterium]|nr:sulfur oxidation c-type cytochrome SoxX [Deltaproteobacteria bacterium]
MDVREKVLFKGFFGVLAGVVILSVIFAAPIWAHAGNAGNGEKIVKTRKLGNCISCHYLPGVESPGDIGPSLVDVMRGFTKADRKVVRQWVRDARRFNPDTIMPPFGPNKLLTPEQIDDVVEYLFTLKK